MSPVVDTKEEFINTCEHSARWYSWNRSTSRLVKALAKVAKTDDCKLIFERISERQSIALDSFGLSDISLLAVFRNVRELSLTWNNIEDLSPLRELTELRSLNLMRNNIKDISPLQNLENITELNVSGFPAFVNHMLPVLGEIAEALGLNGNDIHDLSALANMKSLRKIDAMYNDVENIDPIRNLPVLEYVNLSSNSIRTMKDFSSKTLRELYLRDNPLEEVNFIVGNPNLRVVDLAETDVSDVSPCSRLPLLERISLSRRNDDESCPCISQLCSCNWFP